MTSFDSSVVKSKVVKIYNSCQMVIELLVFILKHCKQMYLLRTMSILCNTTSINQSIKF